MKLVRMGFGWGLLGLVATTGLAQDANRYGFQQLAVMPVGTLKSKDGMPPAAGIGLHARYTLKPGHVLQPRLDVFASGKVNLRSWNDQGMSLSNSSLAVTGVSLEVDYLFFPGAETTGWYTALGLGQQRWDSFNYGGSSAATPGSSSTPWVPTRWEPSHAMYDPKRQSLLATLGGGYQFTPRIGLEARFAYSRMGRTDVVANSLRFGVTFSF